MKGFVSIWKRYLDHLIFELLGIVLVLAGGFFGISFDRHPFIRLAGLAAFIVVGGLLLDLCHRVYMLIKYGRPIITSLRDGDLVDFKEVVSGYIRRGRDTPQVWVLAANKKWYLQPLGNVEGNAWRVICQFGDQVTKFGSPYKVVAITGARMAQSPATELPTGGLRSPVINVYRSGKPAPKA